jgi:hypothetical protein
VLGQVPPPVEVLLGRLLPTPPALLRRGIVKARGENGCFSAAVAEVVVCLVLGSGLGLGRRAVNLRPVGEAVRSPAWRVEVVMLWASIGGPGDFEERRCAEEKLGPAVEDDDCACSAWWSGEALWCLIVTVGIDVKSGQPAKGQFVFTPRCWVSAWVVENNRPVRDGRRDEPDYGNTME